eukprot:CAMPEP_0196574914 /NCGR_PEP_ID=MMETSP1081-20130531/4516_1 /TAXON_ID=36882 /ORGANISM="Pyramimonas amylifera, Strain CCMP720" /LENGTH=173 /DNA_ID=CAMNT_0041893059 /DNA_START=31 /DNA_END=549 /DNA_ORIENTATION=-
MVAKSRTNPQAVLKCKSCIDLGAVAERDAAAAKRAAPSAANQRSGSEGGGGFVPVLHVCSACSVALPLEAFSRAQLTQKGPGKQRCANCLNVAGTLEREAGDRRQMEALKEARNESAKLSANGAGARETVVALAREAALEAELVTGLKPVRLGSGRSLGRGRGRGGRIGANGR